MLAHYYPLHVLNSFKPSFYLSHLQELLLNNIINSKKKKSNADLSLRNKPQLQNMTTSNKKKNNKLSSSLFRDPPNISVPVISVLMILLLSCHNNSIRIPFTYNPIFNLLMSYFLYYSI